MPSINEITDPTQLQGVLRDGIEGLDLNQQVTFQAYSRVVLPIDGYVFWQPGKTICIKGSLHYAQEIQQAEDETTGYASVTFTARERVTEFSEAPINTIYVGRIGNFRYSFSQQHGFYTQAGQWHYFGARIMPALQTQLLDAPNTIDPTQAIVSNSLPLWLALNTYDPTGIWNDYFTCPVTLYPSFLSPPNLLPAYGTVHIEPTRALQAVPYLTRDRSHYQLVSDRVRVTLYGLQNDAALDFVDCVMQYTLTTNNFGIMNMPIVTDGHRTQAEVIAKAMMKVVDFEISYYQKRVADVSRRLILDALPIEYIFEGGHISTVDIVGTDSNTAIVTDFGQAISLV